MSKENNESSPVPRTKTVFWHDIKLEVLGSVYEPCDDSYLLAESLHSKEGAKALDMGCGCGIQSVALALQGANVTAVDINQEAVENTAKNAKRLGLSSRITVKKSDLFSGLKGKKFDVIAFNPPYLPVHGKPDIALDGGKSGWEITHTFLDKLSFHLRDNGACFIVASSLNSFSGLPKKASEKGFSCIKTASKRLFFEELAVFRLC